MSHFDFAGADSTAIIFVIPLFLGLSHLAAAFHSQNSHRLTYFTTPSVPHIAQNAFPFNPLRTGPQRRRSDHHVLSSMGVIQTHATLTREIKERWPCETRMSDSEVGRKFELFTLLVQKRSVCGDSHVCKTLNTL